MVGREPEHEARRDIVVGGKRRAHEAPRTASSQLDGVIHRAIRHHGADGTERLDIVNRTRRRRVAAREQRRRHERSPLVVRPGQRGLGGSTDHDLGSRAPALRYGPRPRVAGSCRPTDPSARPSVSDRRPRSRATRTRARQAHRPAHSAGTSALRMAVHFCPALTVISRTTSLTKRSNSAVPVRASGPSTQQLSESVSATKRTEFAMTRGCWRSDLAVAPIP